MITVARDDLSRALTRASGLVLGRSPLPILSCARIESGASGLSITATSLDAWLDAVIDREPREPASLCLDAARLGAFIGSLAPGSTVTFTPDARRVTIAGDGAVARIPWLPVTDFPTHKPAMAAERQVCFSIEGATLAAAIKFVEHAVADEKSGRPSLVGAFLDPAGMMVACDGIRLAAFRFAASLPEIPSAILPSHILGLLPGLLRGSSEVVVAVTPRTASFAGPDWQLVSKLVDAEYPSWRRVVPEKVPNPLLIDAVALERAVSRCASLVRGTKMRGLRLRIDGTSLSVSAVGDETDTVEVDSVIPIEGGPGRGKIGLRISYVTDALQAIGADRIELHSSSEDHPVRLCAAGETETGVVIFPMRC